MWNAKIVQKGVKEGAYLVNVSYTNGTMEFNEIIDMTGGTLTVLQSKISSRLKTLNDTQTLAGQVTTGPFVPPVTTPSTQDNFLSALSHFRSVERAADIGLILKTDILYTDAIQNLKALFDPSFIDSI